MSILIDKIIKIYYVLISIRYKFSFQKFGKLSYIKRPIYIPNKKNIIIGERVSIWNGARIEPVLKYKNQKMNPKIIIEDTVKIQQNFHCTSGVEVLIKKGTLITPNVGIFDIVHPYEDIKISPHDQQIMCYRVQIGRNCMIGMNSVIMPGVSLGDHTIVGANSVVTKSTEGYCVIAGNPAKIIKKYNFDSKAWEKAIEGS